MVSRLAHFDDLASVGHALALADQLLYGVLLRRSHWLVPADDLSQPILKSYA
jgi:hypothetical protein